MKNRINYLIVSICVLAMMIIVILYGYNKYYLPSANTYSTYMEIYQEYDLDEIKNITASSINHQLIVKKSNTDKVKIDYYQKADNANKYSVNNGTLNLELIERVEDVDNLLFKPEKQINAITIYLPDSAAIDLNYSSISSDIEIEDISIKNINVNNVVGLIEVKGVKASSLTIDTNGGTIKMFNTDIGTVKLTDVSGEVSVVLDHSLTEYNTSFTTDYGLIVLNSEKQMSEDEEGNKSYVKKYTSSGSTKKTFIINTIRSSIQIDSVEPQPEESEQTTIE